MFPVTNDANGEDKTAVKLAISSGVPNLFIATFLDIISRTRVLFFSSFFSQTEPLNKIFPGAIALILIPNFARGFELFLT